MPALSIGAATGLLGSISWKGWVGIGLVAALAVQTVRISGVNCEYPEPDPETGAQARPDCWIDGLKMKVAKLDFDLGVMTALRDTEVSNHIATKQEYRAAQEQAALDQEKVRKRVVREQQEIVDDVVANYETRLARSRADYRRLLDERQAGTGERAAGAAGDVRLPGSGAASGSADEAARHRRLQTKYAGRRIITAQDDCPRGRVCLSFEEAQIASEQAIQLEELQQFARRQAQVEVD